MAAHVLVVDDEEPIRDLLEVNLRNAGHPVDCAGDVEQARLIVERHPPPDLVVLDWMLPGMSGIDYLRALRNQPLTTALPVILLSARAEERDRIAGLEAGADDYLVKPFSVRELIARIAVVLRRRAPLLATQAVHFGALVLDPASRSAQIDGAPLALSPAEFRLLHFLVTHAGRVYSRGQLIEQIWGRDFCGEDRNVDSTVSRLRAALAAAGLQHCWIRTVRGSGYCFVAPGLTVTGLQAYD
jgi:two-component system phosphate regulon response regulator PhoB